MTSLPFDDDALGHAQAEAQRHKENKGRQAGVYAEFNTTGQGFHEFEERIDFGLIYTQKPWMQSGHQIDVDAMKDILELEDADDIVYGPLVTAYVTEWDLDDKRNYVGAWVAVAVYLPPEGFAVDAEVQITHYFSFTAGAVKKTPHAAGD